MTIVVIDQLAQRSKEPVVIEAALRVCPQSLERRRAIALIGRALRLEGLDADLLGRVHVPARLGIERWDVAACAVSLANEQLFATLRGRCVEAVRRLLRGLQAQLIDVQRGELAGDQIWILAHVAE